MQLYRQNVTILICINNTREHVKFNSAQDSSWYIAEKDLICVIFYNMFTTQNSELRNLFNIIHVFMCALMLPYLNTLGVLNN